MSETDKMSTLHLKNGDTHVVGLNALRVLLVKDGNDWFAQGLEVDYFAGGSSVDEAKKNFEDGLAKTIHEHLRMHGNLEKLLQVAPQSVWSEFFTLAASPDCFKESLLTLQLHLLQAAKQPSRNSSVECLPFSGIAFLQHAAA